MHLFFDLGSTLIDESLCDRHSAFNKSPPGRSSGICRIQRVLGMLPCYEVTVVKKKMHRCVYPHSHRFTMF